MTNDYGFGNPVSYESPVAAAAVATITVGTVSPFLYTPANSGVAVVTGGTVSAIDIIDAGGATVSAGITAGAVYVSSRWKGVQIAFTAAPTMVFVTA